MVSMLVREEEGDKIEDGSHPSRSCHVHTGTQAHTYRHTGTHIHEGRGL